MGSGPMITDILRFTLTGVIPMCNSLFKVLCIISLWYLYAISLWLKLC